MNCPECGHKKHYHDLLAGCMGDIENGCPCQMTRPEIERDAWQAEAQAAREILALLAKRMAVLTYNAQLDPYETEAFLKYKAAYVVDNPPSKEVQ